MTMSEAEQVCLHDILTPMEFGLECQCCGEVFDSDDDDS